jgi:hypothetical protein
MVIRTKHLFVLATCAATAGCIDTDVGRGPYTVEILDFTSVNQNTGGGNYALRPVTLSQLSTIIPLEDPQFRFIGAPTINGSVTIGPGAAEILRLDADFQPRLRSIEGVLVPRDLQSLQVISGYASLRSIADTVAEITGRSSAEVIPPGGFQVWVDPTIASENQTLRMETNAFYVPYADTFGFLNSSELEKIPLSAVRPVIDHEFGHHLFHKSFSLSDGVCDPLGTGENAAGRFASELAISGINEGFADWVSFVSSGTTDVLYDAFVDGTLPKGERAIDTSLAGTLVFTYSDKFADCSTDFYCLGTLFARSLFEAYIDRGNQPADRSQRMNASRAVYSSMAKTPALMRRWSWPSLPEKFRCKSKDKAEINNDVLGAFLGSFISGLPSSDRISTCKRFVANFGDSGFAAKYRGDCP